MEPENINQQALQQSQSEHITKIFSDFKEAIRLGDVEKVKQIVETHSDKDLVNRLDPHTMHISVFIAVQIQDEKKCYDMFQYLISKTYKQMQILRFYIARDNKVTVYELLKQNGLSFNQPDNVEQIPIFYAARDGCMEIIKRIIEDDKETNLNHHDLNNQSCLFYAAREGHTEMCKFLIEKGVNPSHYDNKKLTAYSYAKKYGKKETAEYLLQFLPQKKQKDQSIKKSERKKSTEIGSEIKDKKKTRRVFEKEPQKIEYKMVFTDLETLVQTDLTQEDFLEFKQQYPEIAEMLENPDNIFTEEKLKELQQNDCWQRAARRVLQTLWKTKNSYIFQNPVDVKRLGCPDYYEIIKNPMDFTKIKNKLNLNLYSSIESFIQEVKLIFSNAILYNGDNSDVGKSALQFQNDFNILVQTQFQQFLKESQHAKEKEEDIQIEVQKTEIEQE